MGLAVTDQWQHILQPQQLQALQFRQLLERGHLLVTLLNQLYQHALEGLQQLLQVAQLQAINPLKQGHKLQGVLYA
jgi:hypothetical protein